MSERKKLLLLEPLSSAEGLAAARPRGHVLLGKGAYEWKDESHHQVGKRDNFCVPLGLYYLGLGTVPFSKNQSISQTSTGFGWVCFPTNTLFPQDRLIGLFWSSTSPVPFKLLLHICPPSLAPTWKSGTGGQRGVVLIFLGEHKAGMWCCSFLAAKQEYASHFIKLNIYFLLLSFFINI